MDSGFIGMSGFGKLQLNTRQEVIILLIQHGILMVKLKLLKTGIAVKKMAYGLGGIKRDI